MPQTGSIGPIGTRPSALCWIVGQGKNAVMDGYARSVLIVAADPVERERLAAALEGDGFEVLLCSGPTLPDDGCIGVTQGRCPLATQGCVVVLDLDLDSEAGLEGATARDLLGFYLGAEHRVVALSSHPVDLEDDRLLDLRRHPDTDVLLTAVWWSASSKVSDPPLGRGVWS